MVVAVVAESNADGDGDRQLYPSLAIGMRLDTAAQALTGEQCILGVDIVEENDEFLTALAGG